MATLGVVKDVPGYKVILKAVLKSQIQHLIEQLASATNEESFILTASVADGTLSHLGSDSAKGFLEDHEDLKSQFLGYCLKMYHKQQEDERREKERKDQEEALLKLQMAAGGQYGQTVHSYGSQFVSPRKSGLVHPVSLTRSSPGIRHEPYSRPSTGQVTPTKMIEVASVKTEPRDDSDSETAAFTNNGRSSYQSYSAVTNDDENVDYSSVKDENFLNESRLVCGDKSEVSESNTSVNVKQETALDSEMHLEITSVEAGLPMHPQDWGANASMGTNFDPTSATGAQADMTGESSNRRHECQICRKFWPSRAHLEMHVRTHTGEKPFACPVCGKRFNQKGSMKSHVFQVHMNASTSKKA
ncbi:zinc finger protein with KRAB and SCAN domains 5-like isoform X4 [Dreissena polymorpha]|uniref:zinc finger protein with KRAB and SCAN domains 5-like isoform X4 n=1 Tax=Dreissena polymorpha TaxID=45954 RepID=UPI002264B07B|nr:zinc finger protein with KRAB and SCAN domains 5-like isoform X4 [Dreissena polymorpha]